MVIFEKEIHFELLVIAFFSHSLSETRIAPSRGLIASGFSAAGSKGLTGVLSAVSEDLNRSTLFMCVSGPKVSGK